MRFLLDTDTCIWVIRGRDPARSRVLGRSPADLAVSTVTEAELRYGALRSADPRTSLAKTEAFLSGGMQVLPFDRDAARVHPELRRAVRATPIGDRDLMIASVAAARGLTLVTSNVREFGRLPGVQLEDWMRP